MRKLVLKQVISPAIKVDTEPYQLSPLSHNSWNELHISRQYACNILLCSMHLYIADGHLNAGSLSMTLFQSFNHLFIPCQWVPWYNRIQHPPCGTPGPCQGPLSASVILMMITRDNGWWCWLREHCQESGCYHFPDSSVSANICIYHQTSNKKHAKFQNLDVSCLVL